MICRMNRVQRELLIDLIDKTTTPPQEGCRAHWFVAKQEAEEAFHRAFENESSEDDFNHVE